MADDLVARLRAEDPETGLRWSIASEAADRIERLEKALFGLRSAVSDYLHADVDDPALSYIEEMKKELKKARAALAGKDD